MSRLIIKTFGTELRKITRNRKQFLIMFAAPALLILFMTYLTVLGSSEVRICIAAEDEAVSRIIRDRYGTEYPLNEDVGERDILITVADAIEIRYDQTQAGARHLYQAKKIAAQIAADLQGTGYAEAYMAGEPDMLIRDIASEDERNKRDHLTGIMLITMVGVMIGGMNIISVSSDSIAGEKERGVYDGIVLSGASVRAWFIGKQLAVLTMSVLILSVEIAVGCYGNYVFDTPLGNALAGGLGAGAVLELFITALGCSLVFTALFSMIASGFETVKNATSYSSAAMFICTFLTGLPMVYDGPLTGKIPFANFPGVCLSIIGHRSAVSDVLTGLLISAVIYVLGTTAAVLVMNDRERRK